LKEYKNPAMFPSKPAAERAALNGEGGQEFDTQACLEIQAQVLSVGICGYLFVTRMALT
jgi:hypothetical protein